MARALSRERACLDANQVWPDLGSASWEDRASGLCPPHSQGRRSEKPDRKVRDICRRRGASPEQRPRDLKRPSRARGETRVAILPYFCAPCSRQSNSLAGGEAPYVNVMRRDRRRGDAYMNHWIETRSVLDAVSSLSDQCLTQGAATPHGRCPWGASVFSYQRLSSAVRMDAGLDMGALHRQLNFPFSSEHGAPNVGRSHIGAATLSQTHQ
jgi:hypothetical protein